MPQLELIERASRNAERVAIHDQAGAHTYAELLECSAAVAARLLEGGDDLREERVAFQIAPGFAHVAAQWGVWRAGGVAVPLALSYPVPEIARLIDDAAPLCVLAEAALRDRVDQAVQGRRCRVLLLTTEPELGCRDPLLPQIDPARRAMMVYTSGTTGRPKGVVTTHSNIEAQIEALVQAWEWRPEDRILHVLPLHHVHGVVNVLSCALWSGACCEFLSPFEADSVWERLVSGEISLFMAVPTVYRRLIDAWERADMGTRRRWSRGARDLRLMVSGSAALPVAILERWQQITGHRLLERYGMTEIGMALGNPVGGERRAGTVGRPFPGVQARIVDEAGKTVGDGTRGEIQVRGPQVFLEYWQRPTETAASFRDGWFVTGDEGVVQDGYWSILGRRSVDIIKTGGYKVSALEIEEVLREHEAIADAAVVGVADPDWGERVCAALVLAGDEAPELSTLQSWCKERLAPYKVPRQILVLEQLPHNAMGKVVKLELRQRFEA